MNSNYLVIHGSFGSPFINWFPWFYDELTKKDKQVLIPQFPIGLELQNYDNWKMLLDYYRDIGFLTNETIVFAHSIGAIFIVKYLLENNIKVNKLVLVS
ncbi:MAG: alpha/beta hydrolase [Candidatus Peribacteria bacterium]|jgi:predicted alpha/beta hydrolase family esterase|nr:alpha/beta hydrolase [Candidatus Peribacteria bacterium]